MPWFLETDTFADEPVWQVLGAGVADMEDRLQAAYTRLKAKTSHLRANGYLTAATALTMCRGRRKVLDLLCTSVLEQPPLVHRQGDECPCLGDQPWIEGFAYRIHEFLKRNPSRAENDRNKRQRADRRNSRLKAMVYARDGGCCRYCGSGPLSKKAGRAADRRKVLTFDHVDPDDEAYEDGRNYAVCCDRCGTKKGHRTPYEAGMVLLPVPTAQEAALLARRPLQLHELPEYTPADLVHTTDANQRPINDEPATNQRQTTDPVTDRITDRDDGPDTGPDTETDTTGVPETGHHQHQRAPDQQHRELSDPLGSGRGGPRPDGAPPPRPTDQPDRTGSDPDIYHRRSRTTAPSEQPPPAERNTP